MPTRRQFVVGVIAAGAAAPARSMDSVGNCEGIWVGGFSANGGYTGIRLTIADPGAAIINSFQMGLSNARASVACSATGLSLTFTGKGGPGTYAGQFRDGGLRGLIGYAGKQYQASFQRSAPHSQDQYDRLLGAYRSEGGEIFVVGRKPFSEEVALTNFSTGELRTLYPLLGGGYFHGPSFGVPSPIDRRVSVSADETELRITGRGPATTISRVPCQVEEVSITSHDGITLAGTFRAPEGPGPFPTVVLAHGSGPADRHGFLSLQYLLPLWGVATLAYDKRGGGRSGGKYVHRFEKEDFERLARDLIAAISFVKTRPQVDSAKVALVGISQAGWTVPIAADLAPDLATTVLISGPSVAWGLENEYSRLTREGDGSSTLPQAEIERRIAATAPSGFDPQPYIKSMKMPALWLFGARDQSVPARLCAAEIERLRKAGHRNLEVKLYETGQHALWETERGLQAETPLVKRFVPGFIDDLRTWLGRHLAG